MGRIDEHPYGRIGFVTLIKDPHLVVDELEFLDWGVGREQCLADCVVSRALTGQMPSPTTRWLWPLAVARPVHSVSVSWPCVDWVKHAGSAP